MIPRVPPGSFGNFCRHPPDNRILRHGQLTDFEAHAFGSLEQLLDNGIHSPKTLTDIVSNHTAVNAPEGAEPMMIGLGQDRIALGFGQG